jgi:hypothetical protein
MHLHVQVVAIADDGTEYRQSVAEIIRTETTLETLGLSLAESKQLLQALQGVLIDQQVSTYLAQQRPCPTCGTPRRLKEQTTAPFHTLFGVVNERPISAIMRRRLRTMASVTTMVNGSAPGSWSRRSIRW